MASKIKKMLQTKGRGKKSGSFIDALKANNLIQMFTHEIGGYGEYRFSLRDRNSGVKSTGVAKIGSDNTGIATIDVDGDTYEGNWIYAETGLSGVKIDTSNKSFNINADLKGVGNVVLKSRSNPNKQITCEFVYDEASARGHGEGRSYHGDFYDMEIF